MQQNQSNQNRVDASTRGKKVAKSYKRAITGISGGVVALLLATTVINATPPVEMKFIVKNNSVVCQVQVNDDKQSYSIHLDGNNVEQVEELDHGENEVTFSALSVGTYLLTIVQRDTNEVITSAQIEILPATARRVVWMNLLLDKAN